MSDTTRHTVDPKFVIPRQGKQMVLYVGLLDAAHRAGMVSMDTEILQFPSKENEQTCIVRAVVTLFKDEDHRGIYTGIGDANPKNVGGTIVPHFIRMAETRAKARALRDALNVGMVTVEELGGDDRDDEPAPAPRPAPRTTSTSGTSATPLNVIPARTASRQQQRREPLNAAPAGSPYDAAEHDRLSQQVRTNDEALSDQEYTRYYELERLSKAPHAARTASPAAPASAPPAARLDTDQVLTILGEMDDSREPWHEIKRYADDQSTGREGDDVLRIHDKLKAIAGRRKAAAPAPTATPPPSHAG